jgi:hypothetical protein
MPIRSWSILLLAVLFLGGASSLQAQTQAPALFFSDLDSGPNTGGENVNGVSGAYVTLYGNFFGSSQGSSTVTWNGLNCLRVLPPTGAYTGWGMAHLWYQEIVVQLSSTCTPGTGNFVVTTANGTSSGIPFTVRTSGNIYCISTTGNDSNSGKFPSSCWATPKNAFSHMSAGDTAYWEGGLIINGGGGFGGLDWGAGGTAGNPVAMVSYPGATPQPGVQCSASSCSNGIAIRCSVGFPSSCSYFTMAGLFVSGQVQALMTQYPSANHQRYIGNYWTCTGTPGQVGCVEMSENTFVKFYGNELTGVVSSGTTSKQYHAFYLSTDSNHQEVGWNSIHNNKSCRAIQVHSSPNNPTSGYNQYDLSIHDNLIHDDPCDGILLATIDPSQGKVEVYNNLIYHIGVGPDPADGEASMACIRVAEYVNNSPPNPSGTAEIYNNTMVDCGSHVGTFGLSGTYVSAPGAVAVNVRNNIAYQLSGEYSMNSGGSPSGVTWTGSNNMWFGSSQTTPTWSSNNITADPLFANRSANDFHLQSGSPAIGAGTVVSGATTYKNYPPWQGGIAVDRDGQIRPSPLSIGAYEFAAGSIAQRPNPPTNLKVVVQ